MMVFRAIKRGDSYSSEAMVNGIEVIRDLNRIWTGCYVHIRGNMYVIKSVRFLDDTEVVAIIRKCNDMGAPNKVVSLNHHSLIKDYPELGYFNTPTSTVYISRSVSRQWRQGVHANNIRVEVPFQHLVGRYREIYSTVGLSCMYDGTGLTSLMGMIDVFNSTYPLLPDALHTLREGDAMSVALSRGVALALHPINGEVHVMYHDESVGAVDDSDALTIREEFFWLKDTLEEVIHA